MASSLDHLAIATTSIEDRRLDELLGVDLSPGGRHARMGTHNRLLRLGPTSYLELIAIDPQASTSGHPRWFELDEPAMKARLGAGPRFVHWVASVENTVLPAMPIDIGPWEHFQRGDLSWQLTVRPDGKLPADGVVPSLIFWPGSAHPAARLPDAGVTLEGLELEHPRDLLGLDVRCTRAAQPRLVAHLATPAGPRTLRSTEPIR
jgi:hypothetical protein